MNGLLSLKVRILKPDAVPGIFSYLTTQIQKLVPGDQLESIDNDSIDDPKELSTEDPDEIDDIPMLFPQKEEETDIDFNKAKEFYVKVDNDSIDDHREFSAEDPDERDETPMLSPQKEEETDIDFNKMKECYVKIQKLVPDNYLVTIDNDFIDDHREFSIEDPDKRDEIQCFSLKRKRKLILISIK